jgi:hypothetical protein
MQRIGRAGIQRPTDLRNLLTLTHKTRASYRRKRFPRRRSGLGSKRDAYASDLQLCRKIIAVDNFTNLGMKYAQLFFSLILYGKCRYCFFCRIDGRDIWFDYKFF